MKGCASLLLGLQRAGKMAQLVPTKAWMRAWIHPQHPCKRLGTVVPTCKRSTWKAERGGSLELAGQPAWLIGELQVQ